MLGYPWHYRYIVYRHEPGGVWCRSSFLKDRIYNLPEAVVGLGVVGQGPALQG